MLNTAKFALLIFGLTVGAWAGDAPRPFAADPYERIGANRQMSEPEVRRAYMIALNRFDPALSSHQNEEAHERILEAGLILFPAAAPNPATVPENNNVPGELVDLGLRRMQKLYAPFVEALQAMRDAAPPVDHSDWYRTDAESALSSRFEDLAGRRGPVRFATIRKTFDALGTPTTRVARTFTKLSTLDSAVVIQKFLPVALERAQGRVKTKDVSAVAQYITTPLAFESLMDFGLNHATSVNQTLDLLAVALSNKAFEAAPPTEVYLRLYQRAMGIAYLHAKGRTTESELLERFLRTQVLGRVRVTYERQQLLRALEPIFTANIDRSLVKALADIGHASWLPENVTATAKQILRRWQFTGLGADSSDPELRNVLDASLSADAPATRKPLAVCVALLLGRRAN